MDRSAVLADLPLAGRRVPHLVAVPSELVDRRGWPLPDGLEVLVNLRPHVPVGRPGAWRAVHLDLTRLPGETLDLPQVKILHTQRGRLDHGVLLSIGWCGPVGPRTPTRRVVGDGHSGRVSPRRPRSAGRRCVSGPMCSADLMHAGHGDAELDGDDLGAESGGVPLLDRTRGECGDLPVEFLPLAA